MFVGMETEKLDRLREILRSYRSCVIAYSGGVDSVFLAYMANQVLGERSIAVIADSGSLARREFDEALALGRQFGFPVEVIRTTEFDNENYLKNGVDRCYFCKSALFEKLVPLARSGGYQVIAYGENLDDASDIRPGGRAAAEFQVRAPLKESGLSKAEIREFSRQLGLPTADKPQMACLSSRIPHGDPVSQAKLESVEKAEYFLSDAGFSGARVRCHELKHGLLARIEIQPEDWHRIGDRELGVSIEKSLRSFGFSLVTLDLGGYKRGGRPDAQPRTESTNSA